MFGEPSRPPGLKGPEELLLAATFINRLVKVGVVSAQKIEVQLVV